MARAQDLFDLLTARGEQAIDELIDARASEELFLDFKRSADNGAGRALNSSDRANFERAISGFGNSEGGVILWGVDCSRNPALGDVAAAKFPVAEPQRFRSWLEGATSGLTIPPHGGVRHHAIPRARPQEGFVATLIPQSDNAPHQTTTDKRYLMRAGSSFLPVPHAILAGMFGRRPRPNVFHMFTLPTPDIDRVRRTISIPVVLTLKNSGPGIAEQVFVTLAVRSVPSDNCSIEYSRPDTATWFGNFALHHQTNVILRDGLRVPPGAILSPFTVTLRFALPIERDLTITGSCGAAGSPTYRIDIRATADAIRAALGRALERMTAGDDAEAVGREFHDAIFR
jgi:hypothetical protein